MADLMRLDHLTEDEEAVLKQIVARIGAHKAFNEERARWYEASRTIRSLGASSVRRFSGVETVAGWPGLVVDALEERLNIIGPVVPGTTDTVVDQIWADNALDAEYSPAHLEALIHGVAFLAVSRGGDGDPDPTITVESPRTMSGIWDPVRRAMSSAASVTLDDDGEIVGATLFLPDETISLVRDAGNVLSVANRDQHGAGRVMARRLINRPRASRHWGRSEITRPVLSYTKSAMRTLIRSEVASEFFSQPQRWALGVDSNAFKGSNGEDKSPWEAYIGFIWALSDPDDPDAKRPELGEFSSQSPAPFIDLVKMYSQLVAGEAALPPTWLGFVTENPASADQIRATEARHVSRAERRQAVFGAAWRQALIDAVILKEGSVPVSLRGLSVQWRDAATPTKAAATDAVTKLVAAGVLPPTSRVTYELLGYDKTMTDRLVADAVAAQSRAAVAALSAGASAVSRLAAAAVPAGDTGT